VNSRLVTLTAVKLARRLRGVTAAELAKRAGISLRAAQRVLASLAAAGVLLCDVPARKGARRGEWSNVYRMMFWRPAPQNVRSRTALAVELSRGYGVTARRLAEAAECSVRTAQRLLGALVADGVLLHVGNTYRDPAIEARRRAAMRQAAGKARAEYARVMKLIH
jgi:predicted DNA-binding transcriptional regulator YafY